ncbi:hypothetical protein V6N13_113756 [Hibiscus sabdariffa]
MNQKRKKQMRLYEDAAQEKTNKRREFDEVGGQQWRPFAKTLHASLNIKWGEMKREEESSGMDHSCAL